MKFQDFNLSRNKGKKSFTFNDNQINVLQYLPVSDKIDLLQITLQKAEEDGIYNNIKLDIFFHLNLIYLYTDIEFEAEDREDQMALYDKLESNGIFDEVIKLIPEEEYKWLFETLERMQKDVLAYKNTAAAVLRGIIQDLPKNMAEAVEIMNSFDPEKYKTVADFAIAANGGRNIKTNQPVQE